jgi:hypothetical protein
LVGPTAFSSTINFGTPQTTHAAARLSC